VVYGLVTLEWYKDKIFAHVMIERGYRDLVENEERHSPFLRVLTSCCRVSIMLRLGLLVITLPLNMVPVVGNITYAWLNGTLMAWEAHLYYTPMVLYAFRGIDFFMRHPALWREVAFPLLLTIGFGVTTAVFMFSHTFSRQKDWLDDKDVPEEFAEILVWCIIMTEIFVSTIVYGVVCVEYFHDKIFAFVLKDRGLSRLLEGHEHRSTAVRVCTSYCLSRFALGIISLPLHFVPVLGSLVYAWMHGNVLAWEQHHFYFELKGFGLRQQQRWMRCYKMQYSNFGIQALLLEMIPCVGPFFIFTNTCGAALLAEELERDCKGYRLYYEEEETLLGSDSSGYEAI
ncbi:hypothetical protein PHMEG_00024997, partial [Phytophthora megakarya]